MDTRALRLIALLALALSPALADQVIMKDGTVYKGKIQIDTDKAVLIGNPPFDPNAYLLQAEDIEKIIYEEYHPNAPAVRKRGLIFETRLNGNFVSSDALAQHPSAGIYAGVGFRVHPMLELDGGVDWTPSLHSKDAFEITDGTTTTANTRQYEDFWQYSAVFNARLYPFWQKTWKTEPYLAAGYRWSHQIPSASGDSLSGSGWHLGFGAIRPVTTHLFLDARFEYQKLTYDTVQFLGREGSLNPTIDQRVYSFSVGASYRL